eukprot:GFUD01007712.1.p1 GENE.GFUD01007712.1~~GFUD01007712.1.p1  ORF type:complete len:242 (+),score=74.48 GFUD01007712.1:22-726(+)
MVSMVSMVKTVLLLATVFAGLNADEFTAQKTFDVKVGSTKKTATCSFTISYSGDTTSKADSSVSCTIAWPKSKSLNTAVTKSFVIGDVNDIVFTAEVKFTLKKNKNKGSGTTKTTLSSVTSVPFTADASFYPASLWCPQEDTIIFGAGAYASVVGEAPADSYDQCAQRCSELTNESGNSPCFSWTFNSNSEAVLGLSGSTCRLLAYMEVSSMAATGVQSGYHKCWNAMLTSTAP